MLTILLATFLEVRLTVCKLLQLIQHTRKILLLVISEAAVLLAAVLSM